MIGWAAPWRGGPGGEKSDEGRGGTSPAATPPATSASSQNPTIQRRWRRTKAVSGVILIFFISSNSCFCAGLEPCFLAEARFVVGHAAASAVRRAAQPRAGGYAAGSRRPPGAAGWP